MSKAIRENRVLTVHQEPTSKKKDFGEIGFHRVPFAAYFVFPKPLPKNERSRVIGINYQLAEDASPLGRPVLEARASKPSKAKRKSLKTAVKPKIEKPPKRELTRYDVVVRRTATVDTAIEIKADNEDRARTQALEMAKRKRFELSKAVLKVDVAAITTRDGRSAP